MPIDSSLPGGISIAPSTGERFPDEGICTAGAVAIPARKPRWYVVLTKPLQEQRAADHLCEQGFDVLCPMVERRETRRDRVAMLAAIARVAGKRVRGRKPVALSPPKPRTLPAFRGYLFVHIDLAMDPWGTIRATPGVASGEDRGPLLCLIQGVPCPVPDRQIHAMQEAVVTLGQKADVGRALLKAGATVRITDGPFTSYPGVVLEQDGEHVTLSLAIFGRSTMIQLSLRQVDPA